MDQDPFYQTSESVHNMMKSFTFCNYPQNVISDWEHQSTTTGHANALDGLQSTTQMPLTPEPEVAAGTPSKNRKTKCTSCTPWMATCIVFILLFVTSATMNLHQYMLRRKYNAQCISTLANHIRLVEY